jgi:uncharacterized coiled-coil protein SlyX
MTESIENLILEHLKRFQTDLSASRERDSEMLSRLGRLELAIAGLRRDIAHFDEGAAEQSLRLDRLVERMDRVERRLELA